MDGIKISTTQNVELEYEPAGIGLRILSTILDMIFMLVYIVLVVYVVGVIGELKKAEYGEPDYLAITLVIIALLPVILYHFLSETFMNGQSFGKKILGIKVVKLDGTQPGIGSYALRSLLRIIDIHLFDGFVALISVALTDKSQRLGDMAAGTTVIKLGSKITLRDTILHKQQPDYTILFNQVALLNDKDIDTIKDILAYSISNNRPDVLTKLAVKVKTKMGVSSNLRDDEFLKAVIMDYSHYQFEK
ncbi:MAG: RDD family protein [Bacteroidetes bacterium]|nr:RDD family protein [Bacteroidota bacterium]